jgi:putative nucleotidyltransferase with HDIG domain
MAEQGIKFEKLLNMVGDFPTLPTIYSSLNDVIAKKNASAEDVAKVIIQDQAITVKLLKLANSPMYGLVSQVDDINRAIQYIGFNEVRNIVMSLSIMSLFKGERTEYDNQMIELWKHSIATGIAARAIAQKLGIKNKDNFFVAGVLHDIGKLFFFHIFKKLYFQMVKDAKKERMNLNKFEIKKFTIDHSDIGYMLGKKWQLPDKLLTVIKYHEVGLVDDNFELETAVVHIANYIVQMMEMGDSGNSVLSHPNKIAVEKLSLKEGDIQDIMPEILEAYNDSISVFEL